MIIAGVAIIAWFVGTWPGGAARSLQRLPSRQVRVLAEGRLEEWLYFFTAWATLALGSIRSRTSSSASPRRKNERTAILGTLAAGSIYFSFRLRARSSSCLPR
jgi:hypothetical protein